MTFQTDRAVQVLACIKASEPITEVEEHYAGPGQVAWDQSNWGNLVTPEDLAPVVGLESIAGENLFTTPGGLVIDDSCGTAGCAAGWALFLSGVEQAWSLFDQTEGGQQVYSLVGSADGRDTSTFAVDWLGIPVPEWTERGEDGCLRWMPTLFEAGNDYEDLVFWVAEYAGLDTDEVHSAVNAEVERTKARMKRARTQHTRLLAEVK